MGLGSFVRRNRTAILGITAVLIAAGLHAAASMSVAIFPEITFHRISLIARSGDLPVEQTLTALTQPLENAVAGVLGVERVRSITTRGGAQLDLVFSWETEMYRALQLVQGAVQEVRASLPPSTEVESRLLDTSVFPIVGIAVMSKDGDLAQLSDFALYEAAPQLRTIPGVYRVDLSGAKVREYALTVDPEALVAHRLDLGAVERAIRAANVLAAGGRVRDGYHLALTVVEGEGIARDALLDVVVGEYQGIPVPLSAVARVDASLREDFTRAAANGETAVLLAISRQPSGNALAVSQDVHRMIARLAREHPAYRFTTFYDQADLVHEAIGSVRDSIGIGLLLAVATIFVFLHDVRSTVVAAVVIPATVLISCLVFRALGMTFNLMTLGGIAAGIGLVLDDAIVVVESLHRHRHGGSHHDPSRSTDLSISEITWALLGSTLTPVAVLLPLALLGGVPGGFFRPLAVTMSVTLIVSLLLALTFTPAMAATFEGPASRRSGAPHTTGWLSEAYGRVLGRLLRYPAVVCVTGAVLLGLGMELYRHVETGFIPVMDEGAFVLDYWSPPGTSLSETEQMLLKVDAILNATPEVTSFGRRTGSEMGFFLTETNRGDYAVRLRGGARRSIEAIMGTIRDEIHARVPGLRVEFVQILQDVIGDLSGNPSPVEVKLFGNDQGALMQAASTVNRLIGAVPGIVDNFDGVTDIGPSYEVKVDERLTRRVGLSADSVQQWVETAITGRVVGQVLERDRAIPLRLWYPENLRSDPSALPEMTLLTPDGDLAPLSSLARVAPGPNMVQRERENLRQLVRVTARLDGRDLGSVMRDIRQAVAKLGLPAGVSAVYGGLFANQQQAFGELLAVFLGSAACVSVLLLIEFGSVAATLAILIGSTSALTGSLGALWLTGIALNVSSMVGMIMVVGIVAKNGILLLDFATRAFERSGDLSAALIEAGTVRLRPILMTSLAAVAGLAPLAFGFGAGSQMQQPLAVAIVGGVAVSMVFSLIGVPVLFSMLSRHPQGKASDASARG
jgi:CzcA family heavy metal efflux pump